jgi:hypothetical protein
MNKPWATAKAVPKKSGRAICPASCRFIAITGKTVRITSMKGVATR